MRDAKSRLKVISVPAILESISDGGGTTIFRGMKLRSDVKRLTGVSIQVSNKSYFKYDISVVEHAGTRQAKKLLGAAAFFGGVSSDYEDAWMLARSSESAVVTNQAAWKREIADFKLIVEGAENSSYEVANLLMSSSFGSGALARTIILSPKNILPASERIPLAILDGAEALKSWEIVHSANILVLLDQGEYDEGVHGLLMQLAAARDDENFPDREGFPNQLPPGIDMMSFALSRNAE
jgi:hypothetical protein